jgi:4-hydroxy-tetrahydrodipicolinate reductase
VGDALRVAVSGAAGRMGRAVVRAVCAQPDLRLVAAFGRERGLGQDAGLLAGIPAAGVPVRPHTEVGALAGSADVLVEFSVADGAMANALRAVEAGVRPVVGATGYSREALEDLKAACARRGIGGVVAPNFALGAVLIMRFCEQAARYFPHAEVVELHHDRKRDAPSGTALRTAELIARARGAPPPAAVSEEEKVSGARGGVHDGVRVHSVRLPGLLAHQEVLFGGPGQVLSLRHDAFNEECFLPGVLLAVRRVGELRELVVGLEHLLD